MDTALQVQGGQPAVSLSRHPIPKPGLRALGIVRRDTVPPMGMTGGAQAHGFLLQKVVVLHTPLQKLKSGNSGEVRSPGKKV